MPAHQPPVQQPHAQQQYAQQPYAQPQPVQQPQMYQPPKTYVDEKVAQSKIYGAMRMRDSTDKIISIRWAFAILAFQLIVPIMAISLILLFFSGTNLNISGTAQVAVIVLIFLAAVAMVIFQSALVYKLVGRRDEHFRRDMLMKQGMLEYLDAISVKEKKDINVERWTMNTIMYSVTESDRSTGLWALLVGLVVIIPIVGVFAMFYCLHFLTKDVHSHDQRQRDFNYQFQLAMFKMGKIDTISYDWVPLPKRDPAAYVLVSILTLSFFLPYWWYVNIVDMNSHMRNQWDFESQIIHMTKVSETPESSASEQTPKPHKEVEKPDEILPEP